MPEILKPLTSIRKTSNGCVELPGGLLLQWGTATITAVQTPIQTLTAYLGSGSIAFPKPFSAAPFSVVGSLQDHSGLGLESANFATPSATGVATYVGGLATGSPGASISVTVQWQAIGPA